MLLNSDRRAAGLLHLALGLLLFVEGAINLALCIADESGLHLIAFHAAQTVGALLFILPRTVAPGTCILVCAFLAAAFVHALEHTLPFGHLIYAVAVMVVYTHHRMRIDSERPAHGEDDAWTH